jgi:hypothetical protein
MQTDNQHLTLKSHCWLDAVLVSKKAAGRMHFLRIPDDLKQSKDTKLLSLSKF